MGSKVADGSPGGASTVISNVFNEGMAFKLYPLFFIRR